MLVTGVGLSPEQLEAVTSLLSGFLVRERNRHFPLASGIRDNERAALRAFFRPEVLESTRIRQLTGESLRNPEFYADVERIGITNLPDFAQIEAITFENVVVFVEPITTKLLFHELVHVEQYRQLGVAGFAKRYVDGFLRSGTYEAIPLEIQAYGLGAHFEAEPTRPFSVEEEVSRWIADGRL